MSYFKIFKLAFAAFFCLMYLDHSAMASASVSDHSKVRVKKISLSLYTDRVKSGHDDLNPELVIEYRDHMTAPDRSNIISLKHDNDGTQLAHQGTTYYRYGFQEVGLGEYARYINFSVQYIVHGKKEQTHCLSLPQIKTDDWNSIGHIHVIIIKDNHNKVKCDAIQKID